MVHTIKGNAASYGLVEIVDLAHEIEERPELVAADIDVLLGALHRFLHAQRDVLGIDPDALHEQPFLVTREQVAELNQ